MIDDSKEINKNKPMELILGKKFKLPIWERALKTMWVNEVAKFSVDKEVRLKFLILASLIKFYLIFISA